MDKMQAERCREGAARRRARIPPRADARQDLGHADQAAARTSATCRWPIRPASPTPASTIEEDPALAADYTSRGNLVGVVTNGTAVLGPGRHRPARRQAGDGRQGLPVQEVRRHRRVRHRTGRARPRQAGRHHRRARADAGRHQPRGHQGARVLLHREEAARAHEHPGLPRRPARHRDHLGARRCSTAWSWSARRSARSSSRSSGAGAAAIACLDLMVGLGVQAREHLRRATRKGVIHERPRTASSTNRSSATRRDTAARTLADVVRGRRRVPRLLDRRRADAGDGQERWPPSRSSSRWPIPSRRSGPNSPRQARPDCIIATGRSDYPNQVNNVLCFPYIFRGALDCGATTHHRGDEARLRARDRRRSPRPRSATRWPTAYAGQELRFGPDYIIPTPFDSRLILRIAPAVAKAAAESGVATRPIADLDAYRAVARRASSTRPACSCGRCSPPRKATPKRVAYAEGEDERVLRAVQIGARRRPRQADPDRPAGGDRRRASSAPACACRPGATSRCVNPEDDPRFRQYWETYHGLMGRDGITPEMAKAAVRRSNTLIAALMVQLRRCRRACCAAWSAASSGHLEHVRDVIGLAPGAHALRGDERADAATSARSSSPTPSSTRTRAPSSWPRSPRMAADEVRRFGLPPKVAFLSHSNFGSSQARLGAQDARRRATCSRSACPTSSATARCTATPRCREDGAPALPAASRR